MLTRRQALLSAAGIAPLGLLGAKQPEKGEFLVVIHQNVGNIPTYKVDSYLGQIQVNIKRSKPDNFTFLIIPQRDFSTYMELYSLNGVEIENDNISLEWFNINYVDKLTPIHPEVYAKEEITDEQIKDYVELKYGAPAIELPEHFLKAIDESITLARKYKIVDIKNFVMEDLSKTYKAEGFGVHKIELLSDDFVQEQYLIMIETKKKRSFADLQEICARLQQSLTQFVSNPVLYQNEFTVRGFTTPEAIKPLLPIKPIHQRGDWQRYADIARAKELTS